MQRSRNCLHTPSCFFLSDRMQEMRSNWNNQELLAYLEEEEIQVSDVKAFRNSTLDKETKKEIVNGDLKRKI